MLTTWLIYAGHLEQDYVLNATYGRDETDHERASALVYSVLEGERHSYKVWAGVGGETSASVPLAQVLVLQLKL